MMNTYPYIKNIEHEKILKIADQVNADAGQVVSKTLAQNDFVSVTLFAFAKGEEIGTHDSIGDAMVTVIEGTGKFVVDGTLKTNEIYRSIAISQLGEEAVNHE